ncbi:ADP-ribosylglycohydrolase family protein [Desertivibrio insolitus]|uniref:ADP-ribosylglycohydrolase family protein n=1 Tax=Herbiconiux sp. SYSU D00978 TaxID=2812562 RepID=UPI001A968410|nr:ADP-ribosylglycohydrolase family protein [Herbiconiux sp. SYSU D00978]
MAKKSSSAQMDRAVGVLLGLASGDALGAGYEFGPALDDDVAVTMKGGGPFGFEPGEWTDDTSMAIPLAQAAARGERFDDPEILGRVVAEWLDWARDAKDVGAQTRAAFRRIDEPTEEQARAAARAVHEAAGRSAGNGSLMRTAPVALAYLDDEKGLAAAARRVSDLTHFEQDAGDACVLWCLAIRHAVLEGEYDLRTQLTWLPEDRRAVWGQRIDEAEAKEPRDFHHNGWVVEALQGAWSGLVHGGGFVDSVERAVRGGHDTDTVAAIAGSLAGARWGASAVPARWRRVLHGWPRLRARDLVALAALAARGGQPDSHGWPTAERMDYPDWGDVSALVQHPHDDGVWIGAVGSLDVADVDAVVSLCRVGTGQIRVDPADHVEMWLIDRPDSNENLELVLADAADAIAAFRAEGKRVLLHCVQAQSRTPSVAALYSARHLGVPLESAFRDVEAVLPTAMPKPFLRSAAERVLLTNPRAAQAR